MTATARLGGTVRTLPIIRSVGGPAKSELDLALALGPKSPIPMDSDGQASPVRAIRRSTRNWILRHIAASQSLPSVKIGKQTS